MSFGSWLGVYSGRPILLAACTSALVYLHSATLALAFSFGDVVKQAEKLAATPYKKPSVSLPKEIQSLNYDQYRDIRFRPDKAHWRDTGLPFELMFFHQGSVFDQPVKINEVNGQEVRSIKFNPNDFDYGKNKIDPNKLKDLGFAGFRVHYPLNTASYKDEVL